MKNVFKICKEYDKIGSKGQSKWGKKGWQHGTKRISQKNEKKAGSQIRTHRACLRDCGFYNCWTQHRK